MKFKQKAGFTLIESLTVITIVGILSTIAAPFGLGILARYQATAARDETFIAIRQTQDNAQQERRSWQFSIRQGNGKTEWTSNPGKSIPTDAMWTELGDSSLRIDDETTLAQSGNIYYVRFDERGNVQYRLGRITLHSKNAPDAKRCVVISTIIGAMRKAETRQTSNSNGQFCY